MADTDSDRVGSRADVRREQICAAAIALFAQRGIAKTSMGHIAEAAGVSRPALYQYFANKDEIFAAAFIATFEDLVAGALAALDSDGTLVDRLDGFLQRYEGDLWELMSASPHVEEIVGAKNESVGAAVGDVVASLWAGLERHLERVAPGRSAAQRSRRRGWVDIMRLSPGGFRSDQPSVEDYRARLRAVAESVAADVGLSR